jgi:hypothetical protein
MNTIKGQFKRQFKPIKNFGLFFCLVLKKYQEIYDDVIKPTLEDMNIECVRADDIKTPGAIIGQIWEHIQITERREAHGASI